MTTEDPFEPTILTPGRLVSLGDGVFAIAMTLQVFNIKVPEMPWQQARTDLGMALVQLIPYYISFLISFTVIGVYWTVHHRMLHYVKRIDSAFIRLNLFYLFWISFLPFPTGVLGMYGVVPQAIVFYAGCMMMVGITGYLVWRYATKNHRLVDADLDPLVIRYTTWRGIAAMIVFALSIPVALFVHPLAAQLSWILLFVMPRLIKRRLRREYALREQLVAAPPTVQVSVSP